MARDVENLLQLSPKVLFQRRAKQSSQRAKTEWCTSSVQTILCSGQSVTYRGQNLNEISTHSKRVDCGFNSSWNGLDKQSSAEPNIILNFPSDTSFKQPSLFVQAAYNLSAISVNWNGVDDVIMSVDSGLCTVARLLTGIQERANHSFALGMYVLNSNSLAKSVVSNFWHSPRVASPRNFARARVCRPPHKRSPKLETTRSLNNGQISDLCMTNPIFRR